MTELYSRFESWTHQNQFWNLSDSGCSNFVIPSFIPDTGYMKSNNNNQRLSRILSIGQKNYNKWALVCGNELLLFDARRTAHDTRHTTHDARHTIQDTRLSPVAFYYIHQTETSK